MRLLTKKVLQGVFRVGRLLHCLFQNLFALLQHLTFNKGKLTFHGCKLCHNFAIEFLKSSVAVVHRRGKLSIMTHKNDNFAPLLVIQIAGINYFRGSKLSLIFFHNGITKCFCLVHISKHIFFRLV